MLVAEFVDGFKDALLWSAWLFGLSCGLAIVMAVYLGASVIGTIAQRLWNRRTPEPGKDGNNG
jgi:hypothetical protein